MNDFKVLALGKELTLGDCLNKAVAAATRDFITKMDDDDLYGENYLADQVAALRFSGATIVGKQAHYMYLADSNATLLRFAEREHRFTNMVMGPTMLGYAETFKSTPFESRSRGEDTLFLKDVLANGEAFILVTVSTSPRCVETMAKHTLGTSATRSLLQLVVFNGLVEMTSTFSSKQSWIVHTSWR